jgi:hypothetical protein
MSPSQERLKADRLPGAEFNDRLIDNKELVALDAATQIGLDLQAEARAIMHGWMEDSVARSPFHFRMVHGSIGVAQHVGRRVVAQIVAEYNPNASAAEHFMTVQMKRFFERMQDTFCNVHSSMRLAQIFEQHGKLIAAKTRQSVARSHALLKTTGDGNQQLIANEMPQLSLISLNRSRSRIRTA